MPSERDRDAGIPIERLVAIRSGKLGVGDLQRSTLNDAVLAIDGYHILAMGSAVQPPRVSDS
jgi:hypothetical protein